MSSHELAQCCGCWPAGNHMCQKGLVVTDVTSWASILQRLAVRILSAATEIPKISKFKCWFAGSAEMGPRCRATLQSLPTLPPSASRTAGWTQPWAATAACGQGKAKAGTGHCEARGRLCLASLGAGKPRCMVTLAPPEWISLLRHISLCGLWKCFQYILLIFHQLSYGAAQSSPSQLQVWPLVQQVIKAKLKKEGGRIYHVALFLRSLVFRN